MHPRKRKLMTGPMTTAQLKHFHINIRRFLPQAAICLLTHRKED